MFDALSQADMKRKRFDFGYRCIAASRRVPRKQVLITTGGVTVPQSVFSAGNVVSVVNNSGTAQTVTQGTGVTLHQSGTTNTGNRTLAAWGIATVLCIASGVFIISGNVS